MSDTNQGKPDTPRDKHPLFAYAPAPESRAVVDSAPIRAAPGQALTLWPPQPMPEPEPPTELPRPATGWFAYG